MWNYLDVMDKNLLYSYSHVMSGHIKQICSSKAVKDDLTEEEKLQIMEQSKNRAYYLIWFVYRYVLQCATLEEALKYANKETLKKYRLLSYIQNSCIYLGMNGEIPFRNPEDIEIILEILYNRYLLFGQLECFMKHTDKIRRSRCNDLYKQYMAFLEKRQ